MFGLPQWTIVGGPAAERKSRREAGYLIHASTQLSSAALRGVVEEFVTRDGTDHTSVERRIQKVLSDLDAGRVELHFDDTTKTCNILVAENGENPPAGNEDE